METTTIHYLGGRLINTLCGLDPNKVHTNVEMSSIFAADVTCSACVTKIAELAEMGFVPKR